MIFKSRVLATSIILIMLCFYAKPSWAQTADKVNQANNFYQNSQYQKAADIYESLLSSKIENGHLHYNLGNTYIRMGKKGKAISAYLKAKSLLPRDEDLRANLNYAIYETVDKLDWENSDNSHHLFFWVDAFTLEEHLMTLLIVNLAFWLTMGIWVYQRNRVMDVARKFLLGTLLLTLVTTGFRWQLETHDNYGVVLQKKIQIRSEANEDRVVLFELHEGAIVKIDAEKNQWYKVTLPNGETGWVPITAIAT